MCDLDSQMRVSLAEDKIQRLVGKIPISIPTGVLRIKTNIF